MKKLIAFIAPSGYGKSTAIEIIKEYYDIENIKIGKPLYDLQNEFYRKINKAIGNTQDGELLQFLGYKVRKENPNYLLNEFYNKLCSSEKTIITNDDCRPNDYEFLKELGFIFIRINGFKRDRDDHTPVNSKSKLEWQEEIECDYEIDNYGDLETYRENVLEVIEKILGKNKTRKKAHNVR